MLPALNEEGSIGEVIDDIPFSALRDKGYDAVAVVIDGVVVHAGGVPGRAKVESWF